MPVSRLPEPPSRKLKDVRILGDLYVRLANHPATNHEALMLEFLREHGETLGVSRRHHRRAAKALVKALAQFATTPTYGLRPN